MMNPLGESPACIKKRGRNDLFFVIRLGLVIELARFDLQVKEPLGESPACIKKRGLLASFL
ncbi:MAG: hypothetical protein J6T05_01330 [Prevotella sp.]|nr:hypothetical protein [Prevotella sp.]